MQSGLAASMAVESQAHTLPVAGLHGERGCNSVWETDLHWHQQ